jgi:hypothetical protein
MMFALERYHTMLLELSLSLSINCWHIIISANMDYMILTHMLPAGFIKPRFSVFQNAKANI